MSTSKPPRIFSPYESSLESSSSDNRQSSEENPLAIARRNLLHIPPDISSIRVPGPSVTPGRTQPITRTPLPSARPPSLRPQPPSARAPVRSKSTSEQTSLPTSPVQPTPGKPPALSKLGYFPSPRSTLPASQPNTTQKQQQQQHHPTPEPEEPLIAPPFPCLPGTLAPPSVIAIFNNTPSGPSLTNPIFPIPPSSLTPAVFTSSLSPSQTLLFTNPDGPPGPPRFLPPDSLTPETDPSTFRACDCVLTLLWLYSPQLALDFFGPDSPKRDANLEVFDGRVQEHWVKKETPGGGLRQVPQFGVCRVGDEVTIGFRTQSSKRMCRYRAKISRDTGLWTSIDAKDEVVCAEREEKEKVERFGAIVGRELLLTRFWYRQPYYEVRIQVDGMMIAYTWSARSCISLHGDEQTLVNK
ncbi:hypothetical protein QC763_101194 [Podospora pseudopauciseta]|uniref:Uncharacterized protein n=1 Tax=Podospora pseudopauciseta TaxID=2093780 RepID=A0ABR0HWW6_9PEZI|nr:hypothetical protein QC763_101194 [Podospora pseudopauciseta]